MRYGDEHHNWKGDKVGYQGIHAWIRRHKTKTGVCTECKNLTKTDWANISQEYKRDFDDWKELCRKCHMQFDPNNGFKKGYTPWNKGKGGIKTNDKGHTPWNKGKKMTTVHPMLGKHHSEESRKRMSEARKKYYNKIRNIKNVHC